MKKHTDKLINHILKIEGVEDVLGLMEADGVRLLDGRVLIPLNVYLRVQEDNTLGVHASEKIKAGDHFGGR